MLKSLRLGVAAVMLALLALALATVTAQENTNGNALPSGAIPTGTYERFTMLQKIRFGATALVNPSLAESAAVVYSLEPDEVLSTAVWHQEVTDQMSAGRVQFGQVVEAGTKTVLKVDRDTAKDIAGTMRKNTDLRVLKRGKFLSVYPTLGGARPSGEWIAWRPEEGKH